MGRGTRKVEIFVQSNKHSDLVHSIFSAPCYHKSSIKMFYSAQLSC